VLCCAVLFVQFPVGLVSFVYYDSFTLIIIMRCFLSVIVSPQFSHLSSNILPLRSTPPTADNEGRDGASAGHGERGGERLRHLPGPSRAHTRAQVRGYLHPRERTEEL
jgi:hypothetical protein